LRGSTAQLVKVLKPAPLPRRFELMKCALVDQAFDKPGWIFEPKLDGLRVLCIFDGEEWTLLSRNDKPQNFQFPDIEAALIKAIKKPCVLDGEIACLDENGKSSFRLLQQRFHLTQESIVQARMKKFPAHLFLFDILYYEKFDLRSQQLAARKIILHQVVKWKDPLLFTDANPTHGKEMFKDACQRGEEGIIAKRLDSRYTGDRSGSWLKIKCSGRQEFVIGGFTEPQGSRVGFGALLVGYYDDAGKFQYAGKVGTGFTDKLLRDLHEQLARIEIDKNPFANNAGPRGGEVHYVKPRLVAEIAFAEWTQNHMLRQPRFQGLRTDKASTSVRRELPSHVSSNGKKR
jgi:DNA ligase D-like protein (predicted ligase)